MSGFDLSQFLASFFDEARERLASINRSLVRFEAGSLDDEGMIALRRDAHTIKGSALMLGVQDVGDIGHLFEDAMEYLIRVPEARNATMVQFLFDLHDQLEKRLQDPEGEFRLEVAPLKTKFNQLKEGKTPEAETSDSLASVEPAAQEPMIGAEEAQTWRHEHQKKPEGGTSTGLSASGEIPVELSATELPDSNILETAGMIAHEGGLLDNLDNFKPDVSQVEMKNAAQRKASGQYLRVDAERLNQLSNQIVELSTEKAMGENSEQRFTGLLQGVRGLHRDLNEFATYFADWNEVQRQKAIDGLQEKMDRHVRAARNFSEELHHNQTRTHIMLDDLRDQVLSLMLRPLSSVFSTFPRSVRDIAVRCGKKVNLLVGGESVEMDRGVAETLVEPLVHLLNNAVSHGIESPEIRRQCGKPEEGQVTIMAKQSGSEIVLEVVDDGQGLDAEVIRKSAVEKGVTTETEANQMDTAEILELIFRPGFSTREKVDDVSGRGIGMNVVQDTVRKLTGSIRIHSQVGKGTRFVLSLPVSIAVQQALQFRIGNQRLGLLTHMIEQVVPLHKQKIERGAGNKDFIRYSKHLVPLVDLRESLLDPGSEPEPTAPYVIIAEHIEGYVGILVDEMYEEREVIVREVDPYLKRYQTVGIMGNTINADGSVLLLIEPYGMKEMGRTAPTGQELDDKTEVSPLFKTANMNVLLVDDSIIARKVEMAMIERLGFKVDGAIDGIDAREKMHLGKYDILVTDLEMPRLDGFGLVRQLRNESKYEDLPILVISTRESPEDRMRAIEAGADAYLVKQQLSGDSLIHTLQSLIGSLTAGVNDSTNRPPENQAPIV